MQHVVQDGQLVLAPEGREDLEPELVAYAVYAVPLVIGGDRAGDHAFHGQARQRPFQGLQVRPLLAA